MFASIFAWLSSKLSLVLGYISIGVAIVLGCAAIWFYHQNTSLHTSVATLNSALGTQQTTIDQLKQIDANQDKALSDLAAVRERDATVMNGLVTAIGGISKDIHTTKTAIKQLKEHSDEAKTYLDTPLPASVRSVLAGNKAQQSAANDSHAGQGDQGNAAVNAAPAGNSTVGSKDQHQ